MFSLRPPAIIVALITLAVLFTGCGRKLEGTYRGAVKNETHNISADLFMTLNERGDMIAGSMTIGAPLYGDGSVTGRRDGNDFQFTTSDGFGGRITWYGIIEGSQIGGQYVVEPGMMNTLFAGTEKQGGIWVAKR